MSIPYMPKNVNLSADQINNLSLFICYAIISTFNSDSSLQQASIADGIIK